MEKINRNTYMLTIILSAISLLFLLLDSAQQRVFFYLAVYASILGFVVERKNLRKVRLKVALLPMIMGAMELLWFLFFEVRNGHVNHYNDHFLGGKKLLLGSILVLYLDSFKYHLHRDIAKKIFIIVSGVSLLLATGYGFIQEWQGMQRIEMAISRPTIAAYIYSTLSLAFIYALFQLRKKSAYMLAVAVILISYLNIIFTGTRAAMGVYPILIFLLTLFNFKKNIPLKPMLGVAVVILCIVGINFNAHVKPKILQTVHEISSYQTGNDDTSLGARFSMWTLGIYNGVHKPLGQSMESRERLSADYVQTHPENKTAMMYINVHLHNELIDTFSLQGVIGLVLLLGFYIGGVLLALRRNNLLLFFIMLSMLIYGLTDVLLISAEFVAFFIILMAFSTLITDEKAAPVSVVRTGKFPDRAGRHDRHYVSHGS